MNQNIELIASYYTLSGDVYPFGPTEISPFQFQHRVEAAAEVGYKGMGITHADVMATADQIGFQEMKRILDANGIRHIELEFIIDWAAVDSRKRNSDRVRKELLYAAQALGARAIKVGSNVGHEPADVPGLIRGFRSLCQDAAQYGTSIVLEFMPFSSVNTVDLALMIVQEADQPNGALLPDIWHMVRSGLDFSEITKIPGYRIGSVEINDADKYPIEPLLSDTFHRRRLCGEGMFDIPAFIQAIQTQGYRGPWGVEILSETHRKLPLQEMAKRSFETAMAQFKCPDLGRP
jgi:sugar phosphate isomerase/epimerase